MHLASLEQAFVTIGPWHLPRQFGPGVTEAEKRDWIAKGLFVDDVHSDGDTRQVLMERKKATMEEFDRKRKEHSRQDPRLRQGV